MKKLSQDVWLALGLLTVLMGITAVSLYQQAQDESTPPALASFSTAPDGANALALWLAELGYEVQTGVTESFAVPANTNVVLLLEPSEPISAQEWEILDDWIDAGGTLLFSGSQVMANAGFAHFDFRTALPTAASRALQTPLFTSPPQTTAGQTKSLTYLRSERSDYVTHLAAEANPLIVSFDQGKGRVILAADPTLFSNEGLKAAGNPELALNLISAAGEPGTVWFDEWHHGQKGMAASEVSGPGNWLRQTPGGRSLLYAALVIFVALLLQGRAFGRPVPLTPQSSRRGPTAAITALANLSRRAGHRTAVLQDYHHRLKRRLGQRYRLDPTLPDEQFVAQLAAYNPNLDRQALTTLLQQLSRPKVSEQEMVEFAAQTTEWLK